MRRLNIAIDGPAGAGKSTISKSIAKRLRLIYVDTGALYRALGLYALRSGVRPGDEAAVLPLLETAAVELKYQEGEQRVFLNSEDISALIRTPEASMAASDISAIPAVRAFLLDLQRDIAKKNDVIMDGRDIGTVVLPDAQIKIFLTATPEDRAGRRYRELLAKGEPVSYDQVLADVIQRDHNDSNRAIAPLRQAEDAVLADTTGFDLEEAIELLLKIIEERRPK